MQSKRILLIGLDETVIGLGIRGLSSVIKSRSHNCDMLFIPRPFNELETPEELKKAAGFINERQFDLVGISLMENNYSKTVHLTRFFRQTVDAPVIWGGCHPTLNPVECLREADLICRGEAEETLVDFLEEWEGGRTFPADIPGIIPSDSFYPDGPSDSDKLSCSAKVRDIDALPAPDFDPDTQWILKDSKVQRMTIEETLKTAPYSIGFHFVLAQRGCSRSCSYCCTPALQKLSPGPSRRQKSVGSIIEELADVKRLFSGAVHAVMFMDDSLLSASQNWLEEFSESYAERVELPLFCYSHPGDMEENKLRLLVQAGLAGIHIGLQSGCDRINREVFTRNVTKQSFIRAARTVEKYHEHIFDRRYDVITDNPFESQDETAETVMTLSNLRKPFRAEIRSLFFFRGTALRKRAEREGLLTDEDKDYYKRETGQYEPTLLNRAMRMSPFIPGALLRTLVKNRHRKSMILVFNLIYFVYFSGIRINMERAVGIAASRIIRRRQNLLSHRQAVRLLLKLAGV